MDKKKIIAYLLICNLAIIFITILTKFEIVLRFISVIFTVVVCPIIFSIFLFYLLKPLNRIFIKKKMKRGKAAILTIVIFSFIIFGFGRYMGEYFVTEFLSLRNLIVNIVQERGIVDKIKDELISQNINFDYYNLFVNELQNYIGQIVTNLRELFNKSIQLFANIVLIILIVFYLLRDGEKISRSISNKISKKYQEATEEFLEQSNWVLSSYIIGQAKVAFSLAFMVYIGYKIIGITSALFLATTTFVLAFIPFIGFFVSMIIPYIIAITMGLSMTIKLTILFLIAQTLKGRIIVPLIMGNAMKIHPVTDIFLVVAAATLFGPMGAFIIVPIYALIKVFYRNFKPYIKQLKFKE